MERFGSMEELHFVDGYFSFSLFQKPKENLWKSLNIYFYNQVVQNSNVPEYVIILGSLRASYPLSEASHSLPQARDSKTVLDSGFQELGSGFW